METSPSRLEYEGPAPRLFDCAVVDRASADRSNRRLSKAEALAYVRTIRAQLHRSDNTDNTGTEHRRVA